MKLFFSLFFTCCFSSVLGQVYLKPTVEIDVRSGSFKTTVPFDETFNIKGELSYSTRMVILKYGPIDVTQEKKYFTLQKSYTASADNTPKIEYRKEYLVKNGETEFEFSEVGPLRPNIPYKFEFITLEKNHISENETNYIKQEIVKKFATVLMNINTLNVEQLNGSYDDFITMASGVIQGGNLVDSKGEPFKIENYKKDLNLYSYRLLNLHNKIIAGSRKLNELFDSTGSNSLSSNLNQIMPKLIALNAGTIPLSAYSRQAILTSMQKVTPGSDNIRQSARYYQSLLLNKSDLKSAILTEIADASDSTVTGNIVTADNLIRLLELFGTNEFTKQDNTKIFTPSELNSISEIIKSLNEISMYQKSVNESNRQLYSLISGASDVLTRAYLNESFILASSAEFNVASKSNPYISLDAGLIMNFNPYKNLDGTIGSTNYFSLYEGISIYFTPVNKRAPLRMFKWPYNFYKAFNVHIGVAQFLGGYNTYRFSNSLGGIGNLVVGAGLRFNSTAKIGLNATFVNLKNINPTVSQTVLKPFFGLSLTFDINVAKAFANVGRRKNN